MSHTYKSTTKGDDTTITVDESHDQLPDPSRWAEVAKLTAAEKKAEKAAIDAAEAAAKAEVKRIAALPVHVGDTVKLNEAALTAAIDDANATPEALDKATAWRGVVAGVAHDEEADADVASFEDETPPAPVSYLEVVETVTK